MQLLMKTIQAATQGSDQNTTASCDCNYADNYYGDQVCITNTANGGPGKTAH